MKVIKFSACALTTLFIFTGAAAGAVELEQARTLFYQGNQHYSEGKPELAVADYERVLSLGFESGPLYYNLGNAYFKSGSLGKAILNYLRARRLVPKDADLNSNLEYARSQIKGGQVELTRKWFTRMFFDLADSFSLDAITLLSAGLYFTLSALIVLLIVLRKFRRMLTYMCTVVLLILIICAALFFTQFWETVVHQQAVVIAQTLDSKFEPFEQATTFFTLSEGESVVIIVSKEDWVKVRRRDGKSGWVKQTGIELL